MTQPDNFGFSEEAALLKDSARKFFTDKFSTDKLHTIHSSGPAAGLISRHSMGLRPKWWRY